MTDHIPQIKLRPIESLVAYHNNARTHSPAQVEQLQASMLEWGFTNAVLIDDMGIVAGHGRCMALAELYKRGQQVKFPNGAPIPIGMVPTLDCSGWTAQQRRAYILADNQLALNAGYDLELLQLELKELESAGYDLDLIGFGEDELAELLADAPELPEDADPDAAPPLPEEPVSVPGDVWILGPHRVICGDSTSIDTWDRLMDGERADACFTDPPFNVDLGRKNRLMDKVDGGKRNANGSIANDKMSPDEFRELLAGAFGCLFANLKPGAATYVAHADKVGDVFRAEFEKAGFHFSQLLIWNKGQHVLGMADFHPSHESLLYGWKQGSRHRWYGGRKQRTVIEAGEGGPISRLEDGRWAIKVGDQVLIVDGEAKLEEAPSSVIFEPKPAASGLHPSTKPVALIERLLNNNARPGDIVVDAFGGSGSTLIAADRIGMCARLVELSPKYVDVICRRYWQYTGRRPVRAVTGEPFPGDGEERQATPELPAACDDHDLF